MTNEMVRYDEAWARDAQTYAAQEKVSEGRFLSSKGGILKLGDEPLLGNQAAVILLDSVNENTFYGDKWNPDAPPSSPRCYAFGRGDEAMAPHVSMTADLEYFQPQSHDCKACPNNVYGSADTGKGKACQNRSRIAMIPAGQYAPARPGSKDLVLSLFTDTQFLTTTDILFAKLPPTSVKHYKKYVNQVSAMLFRPPFGVITRLFLLPSEKNQYEWHFETVEPLADEMYPVMQVRNEEAKRVIVQGYTRPNEEAAPQGSLKGLRRN